MKSGHAVVLGGWLLWAAGVSANTSPAPKKVWITVDAKTYALVQQLAPDVHALESRYVIAGTQKSGRNLVDKVSIVPVDPRLLGPLSRSVHSVLHHCAGYIAYDSLDAARQSLQPRQTLATVTRPDYAITHQALLQPMLSQQTAGNIGQTIQDLSAFQNRYYNGDYGAQAADWVVGKWQGITAGRSDVTIEQVRRGTDRMPSVVLTIRGADEPDQVLVMGGHLDTVNWNDANGQPHETSRAPGADDDGSGVASLTEALRVMMASNYKPRRTIKLMAYSGEEFGLYGSKYIASDYGNRNVDVIGVLQLDMTDYKGSAGDIYLEDDYTDAQQNQFVENLAATYLPTLDVQHDRCGYACSDHASWYNQGYATSMPFEAKLGDDNPYIHSSQDTYANVGNQSAHALKFSRLALAFAVELGDVAGSDTPPGDDGLQNGVPLTGLSGASGSKASYKVTVPDGASNLVIATSGGSGDVDLYTRYGSAPTTASYDCRPYRNGNTESCSVATPQAGTYYILLNGYAAYSGVSLKASWSAGGDPAPGGVFSNTTDLLIPDSGSVTSDLTVGGRSGNAPGTLKVAVKVVHSYRGDLRLTLIGPNGGSMVLKQPSGNDGTPNIDTTYTVDGSAQPANGNWKLKVDDVYSGDTGYLDQWSLAF